MKLLKIAAFCNPGVWGGKKTKKLLPSYYCNLKTLKYNLNLVNIFITPPYISISKSIAMGRRKLSLGLGRIMEHYMAHALSVVKSTDCFLKTQSCMSNLGAG